MTRFSWMCIAVVLGGAACASRPAPAPEPTPPVAISGTGVRLVVSSSFVPKRDAASLEAFRAAIPPDEKGGECSVSRTAGNGATVVSAGFPARRNSQMLVTLTFDSVGHLMRYSERRGGTSVPPTVGMTDLQRDSVVRATIDAVRSTSISLDWAVDQALAINRGGGLPTDAVITTVKSMENLPQLGPVSERLERIRRLCGV